MNTKEPKYTPARAFLNGNDDIVEESGKPIAATCFQPEFATTGNARLLKAAWNACISAGEKLNINPVLLAERLEERGIAEIVEALKSVDQAMAGEMRYDHAWLNAPALPAISPCHIATNALSLVKGDSHV